MKDLMRLIEQESYQVSDPVTDFLQCLFTNYDFDGAQEKLQECEQVTTTAQLSACLHILHCLYLASYFFFMSHGCIATLVAGGHVKQAAEQKDQ